MWCAWWEATALEKRSRSSSARLRRPLRAFYSAANIWSNPASLTTTRMSTYPGSGTWTSAKTGIKQMSLSFSHQSPSSSTSSSSERSLANQDALFSPLFLLPSCCFSSPLKCLHLERSVLMCRFWYRKSLSYCCSDVKASTTCCCW